MHELCAFSIKTSLSIPAKNWTSFIPVQCSLEALHFSRDSHAIQGTSQDFSSAVICAKILAFSTTVCSFAYLSYVHLNSSLTSQISSVDIFLHYSSDFVILGIYVWAYKIDIVFYQQFNDLIRIWLQIRLQ